MTSAKDVLLVSPKYLKWKSFWAQFYVTNLGGFLIRKIPTFDNFSITELDVDMII